MITMLNFEDFVQQKVDELDNRFLEMDYTDLELLKAFMSSAMWASWEIGARTGVVEYEYKGKPEGLASRMSRLGSHENSTSIARDVFF